MTELQAIIEPAFERRAEITPRTVDVHIRSLRKKIGDGVPDVIKTNKAVVDAYLGVSH